jgi:type II secretory pathway component PulF
MSTHVKAALLEAGFLFLLLLGFSLWFWLGLLGLLLFLFLCAVWCWELFAYIHYRFCRQEEFLYVLRSAAATQAPLEAVLAAYLADRPQGGVYRFGVATLLFFVFPGYYWIHLQRRFDTRVASILQLLQAGAPLDRALALTPGVVSREIALAVTVGEFTGQLAQALHHLPRRRSAPVWLGILLRLLYPVFLLFVMLFVMLFVTVFIVPKYEKIFADFKLKLPESTMTFIDVSRWLGARFGVVFLGLVNFLILFNVMLFSSHAKWYCPGLGRLYRLRARGQFLQTLGLMLRTGKPLPEILDRLLEARLFPRVVAWRAEQLRTDLEQGQPLVASLARHDLVTESVRGLLLAAEKAQNLPWALQEVGDALTQRCVRATHRLTMVLFPLGVFACACLVAFIALSLFAPLVALIEGMHG